MNKYQQNLAIKKLKDTKQEITYHSTKNIFTKKQNNPFCMLKIKIKKFYTHNTEKVKYIYIYIYIICK